MKIGAVMFFTTDSMHPAPLARALEERGFEFAVGAGTHPHPVLAQLALSGGRPTDPALLRHHGPVPGAQHRRHGDDEAQGRHRHRAGDPARPDRYRQDGVLDRPALGRPFPVRGRQRLEPGRGRESRHRLQDPPQAGARTHRGDEGDLDRGRARVSRRVRQFRQDEAVAEAGQKPHPPIIVGGAFPYAARRAIRYGDGWIPRADRLEKDGVGVIDQFRKMATEAGRDPADLPITIFRVPDDIERLRFCQEIGIDRVIFSLPAEKEDKILPILDRWAELKHQLGD